MLHYETYDICWTTIAVKARWGKITPTDFHFAKGSMDDITVANIGNGYYQIMPKPNTDPILSIPRKYHIIEESEPENCPVCGGRYDQQLICMKCEYEYQYWKSKHPKWRVK